MAENNPFDSSLDVNLPFLLDTIIPALNEREDESYSVQVHQKYLNENESLTVPEAFIENITDPLFRDFSKGKPSYTEIRNPEDSIGNDHEIIENLYSFVEEGIAQILPSTDIGAKPNPIQNKYPDRMKNRRAARYLLDVCRRASSNSYDEMEGMQITTPYDHQDLMDVAESVNSKHFLEEDVEAILDYGPDRVGFDDLIEGYEIYRALNSKFQERDVLNQVKPPSFTVFADR